MKYSSSKEDYLKAIYHLQAQDGVVSTNELAGELQTRAASVTDMLKKLKGQKLLNYEPYKGFRLSSEGRKVAVQVVRKHRLWEYFLVEKLNFQWDEVHEIAEELEHISSRKLIDRLDEFLGYPKTDPHVFSYEALCNNIHVIFNFAFVHKNLFLIDVSQFEIRLPLQEFFLAQVNKSTEEIVEQCPISLLFLILHCGTISLG